MVIEFSLSALLINAALLLYIQLDFLPREMFCCSEDHHGNKMSQRVYCSVSLRPLAQEHKAILIWRDDVEEEPLGRHFTSF